MVGAEQGVGGPGLIDERAQLAEQHLDARQRERAAIGERRQRRGRDDRQGQCGEVVRIHLGGERCRRCRVLGGALEPAGAEQEDRRQLEPSRPRAPRRLDMVGGGAASNTFSTAAPSSRAASARASRDSASGRIRNSGLSRYMSQYVQ
jgi:hypothetical protein